MSIFKRCFNVLTGLTIMLFAVFIVIWPKDGYLFMILFMGIGLAFSGIKELIYYFVMAKHMVDSRLVLYKGVIQLNLGIFTVTMADIPRQYAMVYLLLSCLFSAAVAVLRAMEARTVGAAFWKRKLLYGMVQLIIAVAGLISINSVRMVMLIYCLSLIGSAAERISQAFRRTTIVYIQ